MAYGYRLFYFDVTERMGRTSLDLKEDINKVEPLTWLKDILQRLTDDAQVRIGMPSLKNTADGEDVTPEVPSTRGHVAIRWESVKVVGSRHVTAIVRYGRVDGHDVAMGADGDADIDGKAPSHKFRADFFFPAQGEQGLLVVEDIDRSSPGPAIAQWVGKQSKWDAGDDEIWWRMRLSRLSDDQRLAELIANSKRAEIRLERHAKTGTGKRRVTPLKITARIEQPKDKKAIATEAAKWMAGDKNAIANSVSVLAEIAGEGVAELDPDQAGIYLDDATTTKRIDPDRLDDVFVYPLGDARPTQGAWKTAILTRLSVLSGKIPFDIEW